MSSISINHAWISGFTLIEVLISITILAIVLGAVYGSFFSVHRALERFDNVSLKYHEARTALDIMRREIEAALIIKNDSDPYGEDETIEKLQPVFVVKDRDILGKSTSSIEFTAFTFKGTSINNISYFVEEKETTLNLYKKEAPALLQAKEYKADVIEGIESFTIEILFNNKWIKTWDTLNIEKLPQMVRVSIEFDDNGTNVKLTEYARPKIGKQL